MHSRTSAPAARAYLYEVQRMEPKSFRQRRPLAGGGYAWNLGDMQPVLSLAGVAQVSGRDSFLRG